MKDHIEIYVRRSVNETMLNMYVSARIKELFLAAMSSGSLKNENIDIAVELSVLPEWVTDTEVRQKLSDLNEVLHVRIPITALNVNFSE